MTIIYTIGYKGRTLESFVNALRQAEVDAVIDVRLRNTSHLAGYTKRNDLDFLLREGFGIAYEHHLELAPTPEIREAYRDNGDWNAYESLFSRLLIERDMEQVGRDILSRYHTPCLLCAESTPEQCHRRLIAEHWAAKLPKVSVLHL
jgi:uncharacterized protein (DUF488 family)